MRVAPLPAVLLALSAAGSAFAQPVDDTPSLWHPLRPSVTEFGDKIDALYWVVFWLTMIILVIYQIALVYCAVRYRATEGGRAKFIHGNNKLEAAWTISPAIILVLLAAVSKGTWDEMRVDIPDDAVRIECIAQQFAWFFRYPGEDGVFGPRDYEKLADMRAANDTSDAWALDRETMPEGWEGEDPPGLDDYTIQGEIRVPADRPVRILLTSNDVLHSFFLPEFRVKHDAVPGMNGGRVWFEVEWDDVKDRAYYDIVCAELCGLNHYSMRGQLIVMKSGDIDPWVLDRTDDELLEMRDFDDPEFAERVLSRNATWETYAHAMSRIAKAENSGGGGYDDY
ncbi:MAG: cytochrome c oxidase subunit II [Phycisphaerales bacterium]